ncbi:biogenesis of lysosome-related organelles complex 1 subunit 2-like [Oppia nitens]|uniref:biogenesis of lysosome-related organelles complex 1 subunit 2-like n=1 Tax=Oppia nitens TaxID=1686743 RepID=UPI0023DCA48E|nr:biogenesis of lysosome-related organelles complex 1 subunit 2-like [Oppia nitens]
MSSPTDPNRDEMALKAKSDVMFDKTSDYLKAELDLTLDDYKLLEQMNNATTNKYKEMTTATEKLAKTVDQMNDKYKTLLPNLSLIDTIEQKVQKLEDMAYAIDAYSKRLESKFKQLEKK